MRYDSMRYDTASTINPRHAALMAEADAARLAGRSGLGFGDLARKAASPFAAIVAGARSAGKAHPIGRAHAKASAHS